MASLFLWVGVAFFFAVTHLFETDWAADVGAILILIGAAILVFEFFSPLVATRRRVVVTKEAE